MIKFLKKKNKGFTLVELMVVIAIIAVLAGVVVPTALSALDKSKVSRAEADVRSVKTAIIAYYADNGEWPEDIDDSNANANNLVPEYLDKWPSDPWDEEALEWKDGNIIISNVPSDAEDELRTSLKGTNQKGADGKDIAGAIAVPVNP